MMIKKPKPIECDIHLKYICPQCGQTHWLSFKESCAKHFKIVCDCNNIFEVKRTKKIKLCFHRKKNKSKPKKETRQNTDSSTNSIPLDLLNQCIDILMNYGFSKSEAKNIILKSYKNNPVNDLSNLIKQTLASWKG